MFAHGQRHRAAVMKKLPPASAQTQRIYAEIGAALGAGGVELGNMFGMPALKSGGKAFAGLFGDAMVFKLDGTAHADALARAGAELFDPSGMGRPMKAWVVVPPGHAKHWRSIATHALRGLGAAKPPVAKAKPAAKRR
jgi:hypothetical protein